MAQISEIRKELYEMASQWEEESRRDPRDYFSFQGLLDEIFFHADLRFKDYIQYQSEGEFPIRLKKWLDNISEARGKKTLLFLLSLFIFIDRSQLLSLYRDAYRRVIVPFISQEVFSSNDFLSIDYECRVFSLLKEYRLFSITQSFDNLNFIHANDLTGLPKPVILGEDKSKVAVMLPCQDNNLRGLIIFEDFVGTGKQAKEVLIEVKRNIQK